MKKMRCFIAIIVCLVVVLVGCGGKKNKDSSSDNSVITIMAPFLETEPPEKNNDLQKEIEKSTGEKIEVTWVPNVSYLEKINMTLASGDLPNIMVIQGKDAGFLKSAESGAFWDLTNYLKDYPNLSKANSQILKNSSINGKVYGIYRKRDLMRSTAIIRKDWLNELNLKTPETVEELYEVAKAFKDNKMGGEETYGLIIPKWPGGLNSNSPYDVMETWFGAPNGWGEKKGKLVPKFTTDEFVEANKFLKKMNEEGLINPDFATLAADKWNEPFFNGRGGIIIDTYSRGAESLKKLYEKDGKDWTEYVEFTGNLMNDKGERNSLPTDGYSGFLAIPKESVPTEKELKRILTFIDKLNNKEEMILLNNGIEGVNFERDEEWSIAINPDDPEVKKIRSAVTSYAQISTGVNDENDKLIAKPSNKVDMEAYEFRKNLEKRDIETAVYNPAAPYSSKTYMTKGAQLDDIISDARIKFIAGQIDENGLLEAVELWKKSGGNDIIEEVNELYKN